MISDKKIAPPNSGWWKFSRSSQISRWHPCKKVEHFFTAIISSKNNKTPKQKERTLKNNYAFAVLLHPAATITHISPRTLTVNATSCTCGKELNARTSKWSSVQWQWTAISPVITNQTGLYNRFDPSQRIDLFKETRNERIDGSRNPQRSAVPNGDYPTPSVTSLHALQRLHAWPDLDGQKEGTDFLTIWTFWILTLSGAFDKEYVDVARVKNGVQDSVWNKAWPTTKNIEPLWWIWRLRFTRLSINAVGRGILFCLRTWLVRYI